MNKVVVASHHRGRFIKKSVIDFLDKNKSWYEDLSPENHAEDDYVDYASKVTEVVVKGKSFGVLICGTGIGMSIAANKHKGIRAALCRTPLDAELSRKHNDANILVLSSKTPKDVLGRIIKKFLVTKFERGRHLRRVNKIKDLEK